MALTIGLVLLAAGCARELPEPESEGARLYVVHCAGSGCHNPIPPERSNAKVWEIEYYRMLPIMRKAGRQLPTQEEEQVILDYLRRHAWQ